jgi:uncharacterized membrane protein YbaN (DUF454 family)
MRWILAGGGTLFLGLGITGVFVPLLPTTPFLLLSAACYARSSKRLYDWLLNHPVMGRIIREWRTHRRMPLRAKRMALVFVIIAFGYSTWTFLSRPEIWVPLNILGLGLFFWLMRIPVSRN